MPARVQVFILSRDRPDYFRQTLESVLNEGDRLAEVIISDNSVTDAVQDLASVEFSNVRYVRRVPPLPSADHFQIVLKEATAEFLVLFHDDDLMMPGYLERMLKAIDSNPFVSAIGGNALVMRDDKRTSESYMDRSGKISLIHDPIDFLKPYLVFGSNKFPPYPSYMYRRKFLGGLNADAGLGGKFLDLSFLIELLGRAPILWLSEPIMWYRVHSSNDSNNESVADRLKLLRYLYTQGHINPHSPLVKEYKVSYWRNWWLQVSPKGILRFPSGWRERVVFKFLILAGIKLAFTRPSLWRKLLRRLF